MLNKALPEQYKVVTIMKPATDAAGRTGTRISLKHAHKVWFVFNIDQGNAATIGLTLEQSSDVAGTGAKAVTAAVPIWANQDVATSDALVKQTSAASFTTDANLKVKQVVFEVAPEATQDLANGFDCVTVKTGASNVANLTSCIAIIATRFPQGTPPSAVVD